MGQWAAMAEQLIAFHHEEQLQDQMLKWVQETDYTNSTEREKKQQSLDLHVSRMFDDPLWVHYVRFNQRFRPDALKNARLVRIKTACCDKPGLTTHEQIDHARGSEGGKVIFCPHCGRWSEFMLTESPESENDEKRSRITENSIKFCSFKKLQKKVELFRQMYYFL